MTTGLGVRLLLAPLAGAAILGAACSGSSGDDDDAGTSPTPANPDYCVLEWQLDNLDNTLNLYRVVMDAAMWLTAGGDYAVGSSNGMFAVAAFRVPVAASSLFDAATVTAPATGSFQLTVEGVEAGQAVEFEDFQKQGMYVLTTNFTLAALSGSAGVGTFGGVWSGFEAEPEDATVGLGSVTIPGGVAGGVAPTGAQFGTCYHDLAAFASQGGLRAIGVQPPRR